MTKPESPRRPPQESGREKSPEQLPVSRLERFLSSVLGDVRQVHEIFNRGDRVRLSIGGLQLVEDSTAPRPIALDVCAYNDAFGQVQAWPVFAHKDQAAAERNPDMGSPVVLTYRELIGFVSPDRLASVISALPADSAGGDYNIPAVDGLLRPDAHLTVDPFTTNDSALLAIPFGEEDRVSDSLALSQTPPMPAEAPKEVVLSKTEAPKKPDTVAVVPALESILPAGKTIDQYVAELRPRVGEIKKMITDTLGYWQMLQLAGRAGELQSLVPELTELLDRVIAAKKAIRDKRKTVDFDTDIIKAHTTEVQFVQELSQLFSDQGIRGIAKNAAAVNDFIDNKLPVLKGKAKKIAESYGTIGRSMK